MRADKVVAILGILCALTLVGALVYDFVSTGPKFTCVNGTLHSRVTTTKNIYQSTGSACVVATPK